MNRYRVTIKGTTIVRHAPSGAQIGTMLPARTYDVEVPNALRSLLDVQMFAKQTALAFYRDDLWPFASNLFEPEREAVFAAMTVEPIPPTFHEYVREACDEVEHRSNHRFVLGDACSLTEILDAFESGVSPSDLARQALIDLRGK